MDVSIIYVNWNCAEEILESVRSVRKWTANLTYEIIVVDNASEHSTHDLERDSDIRLVVNSENTGFGAGCNIGAQYSCGRYLLFLNPDTRFLNDVLTELLACLNDNPRSAMAGPLVIDESGRVLFEAGRSLPTLYTEFLEHSRLASYFPKSRWTSRPYLSRWDHLSTREVESILGACMLVRGELFHLVQGFDENFFLYSEELDLCRRLRDAGFQIWYVHAGRLLHKERQSTMQFYGSLERIVFQNMRSQHYYFRKHYGLRAAFVWRHMIAALYLLRYLKGWNKLHLEYVKWAMTA